MLKVPTNVLLLAAGVVWLAAGASVVTVGLHAATSPWSSGMAVACLVTYALFLAMFLRISHKHVRRITGYREELTNLFKFFDAKSYLLIAIMMAIGVAVRISGLVPGFIIAFFYSGLGLALITSAVYYGVTFVAVAIGKEEGR
ncbi:MAG: hypothetical protein LBL86_05035 [Coriobacteriales bacterium]|nr:hypothetical protein [Coriobacteriales bacterium]